MPNPFLPVSKEDLLALGIDEVDFVFVSGDAYVDHASFAATLLGRLLWANGYTVAILPQPDWKNVEEFRRFGRPKLGFLVSAGAMDSMVSNYTANNKPRSEDVYAHGGVAGHRPDRALIAYCSKIREAYKGVNVLIGDNAEGKTNLLESIYLTATGRSFRTRSDKDMIGFERDFARVCAEGTADGREKKIELLLKRGSRRSMSVNGVRLKTASELSESFSAVPDSLKEVHEVEAQEHERSSQHSCPQKVRSELDGLGVGNEHPHDLCRKDLVQNHRNDTDHQPDNTREVHGLTHSLEVARGVVVAHKRHHSLT